MYAYTYVYMYIYVCMCAYACVCRSYACPIGMELMKDPVMAAGFSFFRSLVFSFSLYSVIDIYI